MDNSWRSSLADDSRQKIVKRIMDTLQRHMPVTGQDGVDELLKIAWRFEEKIYQAATDQRDYLRKISLKMLSLEVKANGPLQGRPGAPGQGAMKQDPAPLDFSSHSGPSGLVDQRDVVWPKLQVLKEKYLQELNELYSMLSSRSTQPMPAEQLQKLKHYKDVLHRMIPYLRVSKERVPKELNQDKVDAFEKQIVSIMETFKKRRQPQQQQPSGGPTGPGQLQSFVQEQMPGQHSDQSSLAKDLLQSQL